MEILQVILAEQLERHDSTEYPINHIAVAYIWKKLEEVPAMRPMLTNELRLKYPFRWDCHS